MSSYRGYRDYMDLDPLKRMTAVAHKLAEINKCIEAMENIEDSLGDRELSRTEAFQVKALGERVTDSAVGAIVILKKMQLDLREYQREIQEAPDMNIEIAESEVK